MPKNICNICGSVLAYKDGHWVCPACGAPAESDVTSEENVLLYNAAQKLRIAEFGEAEELYRDMIRRFPCNSAAYWGLLLAKNGIKYETDVDGSTKPTCYGAMPDKITDDNDFKRAIELCSDSVVRAEMISRAERLEEIRRDCMNKVATEPKYDVFLCFKDTDNGQRTEDSYEVSNLYTYLSKQGYNVFFSRESLRDKVAEEYEPYIYNALDSAKTMIVYGSKLQYFDSTWMRNEWTRFRCRIDNGEKRSDALVVVCDKGLSAASLPGPLNKMQVLNATFKTFYGDLSSHIKQVLSTYVVGHTDIGTSVRMNVSDQTELADVMMQCGRFDIANKHYAKAFSADKKNFRAAWGMLLSTLRCADDDALIRCEEQFFDRPEYTAAFRIADKKQQQRLKNLCKQWASFRDKHKYDEAVKQVLRMCRAEKGSDIVDSDVLLETIPQFVDMMQRAIDDGGVIDKIVIEQFRDLAVRQKVAFIARYVPSPEQRRQRIRQAEAEARKLFACDNPTGYSHEGALYVKRVSACDSLADLLSGEIPFEQVIDTAEKLGTLAEKENFRKLALAQKAYFKLNDEIEKRKKILQKLRKGGTPNK